MSFSSLVGVKKSDANSKKTFFTVKSPQVLFLQGKRNCIPLDEFIYTPNGLVQVKDVYEGMPILGGYVKGIHFHEDDVYEITINGVKYRFSSEHPIWIKKHERKKNYSYKGKWITVKEIYDYLSDRKSHSHWYALNYYPTKFKFETLSIGKSFAKLLGYLTSDGTLSEKSSIAFTNKNRHFIEEVIELSMNFTEQYNFSIKGYMNKNCEQLYFTGRHRAENQFKTRLGEIGILENDTFGKIQCLPDEELIEFLSGQFNGDGNITIGKFPTIKFSTGIHRRKALELQFILWRLKIKSKVYHRKPEKPNHKGSWYVMITEKEAVKQLISVLDHSKYPEYFRKAEERLEKIITTRKHERDNDGEWAHILKIEKIGKQVVCGWTTNNSHEIIGYMGIKTHNSGKDYVLEKCVTTAFDNGITCFHGWGARNNENWFYGYNNNCETKWNFTRKFLNYLMERDDGIRDKHDMMKYLDMHNDEMFGFFTSEFLKEKWIKTKDNMIAITQKGYDVVKDEPLHCHCKHAFPITVFVSSNFTISPTSIENYNKQYFWDYKEYQEAYMKKYVTDIMPKNTNFWKVQKPPEMQKDLVKIFYFTPPSDKKLDVFQGQFKQYLLQLRSEHRIGVQNPVLLTNKFKVLAAEINALPDIMTSKDFEKPTVEKIGKPEYMWNKYEKMYDRLLIALGELKTIAPSQKMSGEVLSTEAKRALFDKVGEWRHWKMHLIGSYQNPEDLYAGVRYQADYIAIKRASKNLLGDDFTWLFFDIEEKRKEAYRKYGITEETLKDAYWMIDNSVHVRVNKEYPRIQNLPDDMMIVTDIDNSWYYMNVPELDHHHKHTLESFGDVFKLDISVVEKQHVEQTTDNDENDDGKVKTGKKSSSHHELMERYDYQFETMQKKAPEIAVLLLPSDEWNSLTDDEKKIKAKNFYNQYRYWKQAQSKRMINQKFDDKD